RVDRHPDTGPVRTPPRAAGLQHPAPPRRRRMPPPDGSPVVGGLASRRGIPTEADMGIWDRITGQLGQQWLDVIEWVEDRGDTLLYRYPIHDRAITDQSKLVVREGQQALFVAEGALSQVFGPGTYTLDTPNAP